MYATGARAQEICDFTVDALHINDKNASVTLIGKGSKARQVGISLALARTVQNILYIDILKDIQKSMYFPAKRMNK